MKNPKQEQINTGAKLTIQEPKHNFIILYDSVYKNTELTTDELALIVKLLSSAPTFKPTQEKLSKILNIERHRLIKASQGLQEKGYLTIKKFGNKSEWIISQEPTKQLKDLKKETLINALLNFDISMKDLKRLHKLKYIDDRLLIETTNEYFKEQQRIIKTKWLDDE